MKTPSIIVSIRSVKTIAEFYAHLNKHGHTQPMDKEVSMILTQLYLGSMQMTKADKFIDASRLADKNDKEYQAKSMTQLCV